MTSFRTTLAALALATGALGVHAQEAVQCPEAAPDGARCYDGADANGALYLIAIPQRWNQVLVVHAHDGPSTKAAHRERVADDLGRWSAFLKSGYAWAGTSYRRAGYGVRSAAEDVESLRALFVARFGTPRRTLVHGQGWGANVAARAIEIHPRSFDGALLTSGELAGGSRGEDYRVDLRVVYQFYCRNLPRPDEPPYALWMGLEPGSTLTSADVRARLNECTGSNRPANGRTASQRRALAAILAATRIPERTLPAHLAWSTLVFADLVQRRLAGRNPFATDGVRYQGTVDDRALNVGVARYRPDPAALAELAEDSDPTGRVSVPVLTLHGIGDPIAFVEHESAYRAALERAGSAEHLVQVFTNENEHRSLSSPEYVAALGGLLEWVDHGRKPSTAEIAAACRAQLAQFEGEGCRVNPDYRPPAWETRVYPRVR